MNKMFRVAINKCSQQCPNYKYHCGGGHMEDWVECSETHKELEPWKYKKGDFPEGCVLQPILKIFKHVGGGHWVGSCVIVSAVSQEIAEQFIRTKLDACGLKNEDLCVHEVENAMTQSSLILCESGDY